MINISNYTSQDNTPWLLTQPGRAAAATGAPARTAAGGRRSSGGGPAVRIPTLLAVLLSWLAAMPRRLGDRLFAMNDAEAYWHSWQITRTHGGLGRRYRDPQFGTLAECPKWVTLGEVCQP